MIRNALLYSKKNNGNLIEVEFGIICRPVQWYTGVYEVEIMGISLSSHVIDIVSNELETFLRDMI